MVISNKGRTITLGSTDTRRYLAPGFDGSSFRREVHTLARGLASRLGESVEVCAQGGEVLARKCAPSEEIDQPIASQA